MTQTGRAQRADFLVAAVHNASRTALTMAVVVVALIGTDAAVAINRTSGSSPSAPVAAASPSGTGTSGTPSTVMSPKATSTHETSTHHAHPNPAKALLARALANALAKGSVHTVARNVSKKYGTSVFDNYDALNGGVQHFTIYGGNLHVRVVGPTTYFTGDERGLTRFFGFTKDEVAVLHHQWLTLRAGQAGYKVTTAGITLKSVLHVDRMVGHLQLLPQQVRDGIDVVGIEGRAGGNLYGRHAKATMWVSAGAHPLPVEFVVTSRAARSVQRFSDWGKPVRVAPPTNVFSAKTLEG